MRQRNVGIFVFEDVEVLDFAGPFEVFNVTAELNDPAPFNVYTIAETSAPIKTRGALRIHPNYPMTAAPQADILIVPGGAGTRPLLKKPHVIDWLRTVSGATELLCSVCTGSMVLGKAGLLDGLVATTHHENFDDLRAIVGDKVTIVDDTRYTVNDGVLTSGGISAGIDMSLYLVRELLGDAVLARTLAVMEYDWTPDTSLRWKPTA
ncbi:MAG: DJ-1/PfpI family protein [Chloroflexota bacterium]